MRPWLEALLKVIAMAAIQVPAPGVGMRGRISMRDSVCAAFLNRGLFLVPPTATTDSGKERSYPIVRRSRCRAGSSQLSSRGARGGTYS